jgi:uncharacterized membrane protein
MVLAQTAFIQPKEFVPLDAFANFKHTQTTMTNTSHPPLLNQPGYRISSIDLLRGLVMIIMALDHTRDFFHATAMTADPLTPETTSPALFFTRWITHYCAPTFVFLSGLSAFLASQKKNSKEASLFLIKRGLWLVFVEIVVVSFGLTFDYKFPFIIWQVIWAIGCSMIILGLIRALPVKWILLTGCIIFFGHDLINYVRPPQPGTTADIVTVLLTAFNNFIPIGSDRVIGDFYAILPWTGVMLLGYGIGPWFSKEYSPAKRKRNLLVAGLFFVALFIILRWINKYGDPAPRQAIEGWRGILAFLNASKYPPSLMFCCMTLGPSLVFLALSENIRSGWSKVASVYGKVPFFYYILHFYIIHSLLIIVFFVSGYTADQIRDPNLPFLFRPANFGFNLAGTYLVWICVVASLYFPCRWFYRYKTTHPQWWLKYL